MTRRPLGCALERARKAIMSADVPRALLRSWYITMPGFLLSVAAAAVAFVLVPQHYTSSGTAVLVQPKLPGTNRQNQNQLLGP